MPTVVTLEEQEKQAIATITTLVNNVQSSCNNILQVLQTIQSNQSTELDILKQILGAVTEPNAPVGFQVDEILNSIKEGNKRMAKAVKAGVDFQLQDNGTATATLTPVDAAGNPTTMPVGASVPSWTSSSTAVSVSPAADGMTATLTPTALATGVVISASSTLSDGTSISGSGNPIDVVAGPATGFQIQEQ